MSSRGAKPKNGASLRRSSLGHEDAGQDVVLQLAALVSDGTNALHEILVPV